MEVEGWSESLNLCGPFTYVKTITPSNTAGAAIIINGSIISIYSTDIKLVG